MHPRLFQFIPGDEKYHILFKKYFSILMSLSLVSSVKKKSNSELEHYKHSLPRVQVNSQILPILLSDVIF